MLTHLLSSLRGVASGLGSAAPALSLRDVGAEFIPRVTPDFPPFHALLEKAGEPYPVVVEGADVAHARRVLEGELHRELEHFLSVTPPFEGVPWIALVRSLDGTPEGMAFSWLSGRGDGTRMRCDRVRKRVLSGEDAIRHVGLVLLIAQLRWMKMNGHWPRRGDILREYDPRVMASYRRTCGLEKSIFDELTIATASVGRWEGERFLAQCPIPVRIIRENP
jgi:hypothetical protein